LSLIQISQSFFLLVVGYPIRLNYWCDVVINLSISLFLSLSIQVKFSL